MTDDNHGVLEAARAIRPYLPDWLTDTDTEAADVDQQIAVLLTHPDPATRATDLRALLNAHRHTARFLREVLDDAPHYRPPDQQPGLRARPLGDITPVPADRYTCPHGDYTWYRPDLGTPIPTCPTHHVALTRS